MSTDQFDGLEIARTLATGGVPIFLLDPALRAGRWDPDAGTSGCGYWIPSGWEQTEPDPDVLDRWVDGMAVAAVMGHVLDLVDVDPRNGGTADAVKPHLPEIHGIAATPSGGLHAYVRTIGVRSRDGVLPGIDVKSGDAEGKGRGFGWIAPTLRRPKQGGDPQFYRWRRVPDLSKIAQDRSDTSPLVALVQGTRRNGTGTLTSAEPPPWDDLPERIGAGQRHKTVHRLASALRGRGGWRADDAVALMASTVWPRIDQGAGEDGKGYTLADLEHDVRDVFGRYEDGPSITSSTEESESADERTRPPTQATILTDIGQEADLWHDPDGVAWATITIGDRHEHHAVRAKGFRTWLRRRFYEQQRKSASAQAVQDAVENLAGIAEFDGDEHQVHLRVAALGDAYYLDLADDRWRAVKITADGWEIVTKPPVKFQRRNGMLALPAPEAGGSLEDLRTFVNVSDEDWVLVKAWLTSAARPSGPYPVLNLIGQQGSGKSTTARVLRRVIDPNVADVRRAPSNERDLIIAASNGQVVSLENLSWLPAWLSDALAALATGSGFSSRTLYENADETIFSACRPIILNGIEEVAVRPDLLDRSILVNHPTIGDAERATEEEFWEDFYLARPKILGAICDAVATGLRRRHLTRPERLPRMADFALWSMACAPALGTTMEKFILAYANNQHSAHSLALEESPVGIPIRDLVAKNGSWEGSAGALLELLTTDDLRRMRSWPKSGQQMAGAIKRIAPALADAQVEVAYEKGTRTWKFGRLGSSKSAMSATSVEDRAHLHTHSTFTSTQSDNGPTCVDCEEPATATDRDGAERCGRCVSWADGGAE